jgi:hypothetical protein
LAEYPASNKALARKLLFDMKFDKYLLASALLLAGYSAKD